MSWAEDQVWERDWWGTCANTFGEEAKQITYAHRMGLVNQPDAGHWPSYDLGGRSVVDIGGGPASILLKCRNAGRLLVVDPCPYPSWVSVRYVAAGVGLMEVAGEEFVAFDQFDEAWVYNVLQHVADPRLVVENARRSARLVRIFEWVDVPPHQGHPHTLTREALDEWLGGVGTVETMNENGAEGHAYFGVFAS